MKHYESDFLDIYASFAVSVATFNESCNTLLAPLSLPDDQIKNLLCETNEEKLKSAWVNAELEKKLAKRLGRNSKTYLAFANRLSRRISQLARKLKLGPEFMVRR